MAGPVVQMDYEVIETVAKGFDAAKEATELVGKVTDMVITAMIASAGPFSSLTIGPYLTQVNQTVQQKVRELAKMCTEFSGDLRSAIKAHQDGDTRGGQWFQKGRRLT